MGKRKPIPKRDQDELLILSARHCCLCYGLDGDLDRKKGQIAHVNQDPADNRLENLVWLCLDHHDEYDARTSQSKGLTPGELVVYLERLYREVESWSSTGKLPSTTIPLRSRLRELLNKINPEILRRVDKGQKQIEVMISLANLTSLQQLREEPGFDDLLSICPTGSVIAGGSRNRIGNAINDVQEGVMLQGFFLSISSKLRESSRT
jgi:hypothetical protein